MASRPVISVAISLPTRTSSRPAISLARSPTTPACAFRRAMRRGATTPCRSSPISASSSFSCRLMVATGLTMSPGFDAVAPWLARPLRRAAIGADDSLHHGVADRRLRRWFMSPWCWSRVLFNNLRSMITGRYAIETEGNRAMSRMPARGASIEAAGHLDPPAAAARFGQRCRRPASRRLRRARPGRERCRGSLRGAETLTMAAQRAAAVRPGAGARVHRGRDVARVPVERHRDAGQRGLCARSSKRSSPTGGSRSAGWSPSRCTLSLADLKGLPSRTQITRHDCVEGWSAIGKWTGVPLGLVLQAAGLAPDARYVVFDCADELEKTADGTGHLL